LCLRPRSNRCPIDERCPAGGFRRRVRFARWVP